MERRKIKFFEACIYQKVSYYEVSKQGNAKQGEEIMKKPRTEEIKVLCGNEREQTSMIVQGLVFDEYPGLALNKELCKLKEEDLWLSFWDEENNCYYWAITHTRSGRTIHSGFMCLAEAAMYLEEAGKSGVDWSLSIKEISNNPDYVVKIGQLRFNLFMDTLNGSSLPLCPCRQTDPPKGIFGDHSCDEEGLICKN